MEKNQDVCLNSWNSVLPQVLAATVVTSLNLCGGQIVGYSGVIIPQMIEEQNATILITESDSAWIASAPFFSCLALSLISGVLIDRLGRLKTIMLSSVPSTIGLCLIATASNMFIIIFGRFLLGISLVFIGNASFIYISEISRPDIRGSFLALTETFTSIGIVLMYVEGWVMHWRTIAWVSNMYIIILIILTLFVPESPSWLILKKRTNQAKKSLSWFYKYNSNSSEIVDKELAAIENEQHQKKLIEKDLLKSFLLPTFYKPFLILTITFFFQQFTGAFLITLNSVIFFKEIGTEIDPYLASIYIFSLRVVATVFGIILMKKFSRRTLLMVSGGGMAVCISLSGLNTYWIQQGTSNHTWIPLCLLLCYIAFSSIGIMPIPYIVASEMFPLTIRGIAFGLIVLAATVVTSLNVCAGQIVGYSGVIIPQMMEEKNATIPITESDSASIGIEYLTGAFLVMLNSVIFFKEIGTEIDPYLASIYIFSLRVVVTLFGIILMKKFSRRTLLLVSGGGMAVCISLSGLNTYWIQQGTSNHTWIPLCLLLCYIAFSSMGVVPIPYIVAGEMFPLKIRDSAKFLADSKSDLTQQNISELEIRLKNSRTLLDKFNDVQLEIELLVSNDADLTSQILERETLENKYKSVVSATAIISSSVKSQNRE
ncbi:hypothetical protein RN001_010494 [Aquatica leii]|uniref:Major facilitator superfamily (MFS) profile domain-containing protein n=1 Tax=Aquatica leii TaxID=1421715 RepID=A0AAN7P7Y8_9COLE|nr:hypothetical protein RN001_010494 [Aquatica leii]